MKKVLLLLLVMIGLFACKQDVKQTLTGKWKMTDMKNDNEVAPEDKAIMEQMTKEIINNSSVEFKNDFSYESNTGGYITSGKWSYDESSNSIILEDTDTKIKSTLFIKEVAGEKIIFESKSNVNDKVVTTLQTFEKK